MSHYSVPPTIRDFMRDSHYVRWLAGPVGSGKSVACCHEVMRLAMTQAPNARGERCSRTLVVRNTLDQLRSTTMKTFFDWFPVGVWGEWRATDRTFYIDRTLADGTTLKAEICFNALDEPSDVRKVLSLELTYLWGNEARELRPEIIDGLLMRLRRYPSRKDGGATRSCAIFDTNMPDLDSWHFKQMEEPPENWGVFTQPPAIISFEEFVAQEHAEPDPAEAITDARGAQWWVNPRADNLANLETLYYPDIVPGKSEDFVNVFLRCRYGRSLVGRPVYETTFSPDFHIAKEPLVPLRSETYPLVIGQDFGRTPAAVIGQRNVHGQLVIFDEVHGENMGIETFLSSKLMPRLAQPDMAGCAVLVAPDPAGFQKQQIGEVSPADIIKQRGLPTVRPLTNDPERRIEAVERLLLDHVDGKPALVVNPSCVNLIKGFRYGYRYKLDRQGIQANRPDKNEYSHLQDALQYCCMVAASRASGAVLHRRREVQVRPAAGWT